MANDNEINWGFSPPSPDHVSMKNVHDIPQREILGNSLAPVTLINYGAINKLSNFLACNRAVINNRISLTMH